MRATSSRIPAPDLEEPGRLDPAAQDCFGLVEFLVGADDLDRSPALGEGDPEAAVRHAPRAEHDLFDLELRVDGPVGNGGVVAVERGVGQFRGEEPEASGPLLIDRVPPAQIRSPR